MTRVRTFWGTVLAICMKCAGTGFTDGRGQPVRDNGFPCSECRGSGRRIESKEAQE